MAGAPVSCENDPNFGIILSFMEQFGPVLDIGELNIAELKAMLENSESVPQALADLHIKLMRKINKKVPAARWELALAKFAHSYSHQDAWEIERFGYKTANLAVKLRVLKALLEGQFDLNTKFKTQINTTGAGELRLDPLGRDREGNCYWYFMDESANVQIYQSDPEMEAWTLVARNRDEFANMINMLKENRPIEPLPAANPVDEEDDSAGSASDAEGMKLGTILAPSETPPSLIISRRTYKTCDKVNASIVAEEEANTGEDSERPHAAAVEDADVEMKTIAPMLPTEPRDAKGNVISVEKCDAEEQATKAVQSEDTAEVAKTAESDVKNDDIVDDAMQCELDSKDEEMSTQVDTTDGEKAEESTAIDKCIKKEEPVTKVEQSKSEPSAKDKEEGHVKAEAEREEKSSDDKETEEQKDAKEPEANGTAQPDSEKPVGVPQPSPQESLPVVACEENKQDIVDKPDTEPAAVSSVGEAIEDPPVVVRGTGSGAECDSGIEPMFSEVIEEPIMFFYGAGAGVDNGMGNTKKVEPALATPESATANEAKLVGKKERVPSTDDGPVTSKAGNGERKSSPKGQQIKDGSSKSASKASAMHSDGGDDAKHEKNKSPEEAGCTDNGGGDHANTPSKRELSAKENDTVELGDRAEDDGCDGGTEDREAEEVEPSQKKRTRKPPLEKSQKVVGVPRGKRSEKSSTETVAPVATATVAEVAQEKPVEKKRGSRKSSTPKKALDSITATAILMHESQEVKSEEQLKIESEEKPQPSAGETPAEDIKLGSVAKHPERNGDHLQQPQASCVEDNSNGVKKEERMSVKEERIAECKKDSKSDVKKLTAEADPEEGKPGTPIVVAASKDISEKPTDAIAAATKPAVKEEKQEELEKQTQGGGSDKGCPPQEEGESPAKRKRRQRNGLVDGLDISMVLDAGSDGGNNPPVRQSRRIAMQKIKEETNRRQIEDEMLKKMKADAVKKKKDLGMHISDDEYRRTESTPDQSDSSSSGGGMGGDGRRRKKKKKKKKGSYQQQLLQQQQLAAQLLKKQTTWNSATSPESSSETEAEDYFAEPYHSEEDVRRSNVLKSDHEFSPESDLESEAPAQPLKRARTARKARRTRDVEEEEEDEEESDGGEDHACQECKKTDQPEWILLCDSCDKGYHCACLKPVLFTIPEGDWFCPVCQHRQLIERLQSKLELYDALQAKLEAEAKRREEEEQCAREAELAEQELEREREEQLRAQKRARQQQRLLERADSGRGRGGAGGNSRRSSRSRSASLDSSREEHQRQRRRRKQRGRNRKAAKRRRSSRSRSGDGSGSGASGGGSEDGSGGSGSGDSGSGGSGSCTDSDDMPIYKHLRRRASTKVSYKFNEYDNLIDSAIRREMRDCEMMEVEPDEEDVDDDEGHGFSKGKDISTIIEATTREEQARKKAAAAAAANEEGKGEIADRDADRRLNGSSQERAENDGNDAVPSPAGEEGKKSVGVRQDRTKATTNKKARKKKKKLCKIELSSEEEEDDSDEDFRGDVSGSDDEEEEDDDDEDDDENSLSGDSESSLEVGRRGRNADRSRKPSSRAAVSRRRRIVENSDDSEDEEEERRREIAKKNRKNRRVLDDSDEDLDLDDDDEEEDSEDYDSDDLCSDTETESSRSSANSSNSSSSSSSASTEGDWRRKKKKKTKGAGGGGKTKSKSTPSGGGGLGSGKHIERPPKKPSAATAKGKGPHSSGEDSGDSDSAGKGGKTMPRKPSKKSTSRSSRSPESGKGEKKSDRKTRGKKIHYIVDDDFESSDDGIRPGVQRPDTPPEEREQFIRRQEEIKRMLAENNAAKAKELATSKIDQLVGGRAGPGSKESAKDSLSAVPMQVIESARILDIDFLKSTSGNTARISTVDSVVDFDDELPEDFDPDDEMDDEALAKIMEEEDFAHHQLKPPGGVAPSIASAADLLPPVPGPPPVKANRRKSIPDPGELLLPQQRAGRLAMDAPAAGQMRKDLQHHASPLPANLASSAPLPPHVQSPMKALLKPTGIPTSTIMPPMVSAGSGGGGTILANALQTTAGPHGHHGPTVPPPPLVKEPPHPGASRPDVLMRSLGGQPPPAGSLHHKPSDLSHLMAGLAGSGVPLPLAKGGGVPLSLPPPHTHHSSHRLPPVGLGMPPGMPPGMMGHGPPPHAPHLGLHTKLPPGVPPGAGLGSNMPHSAAAVAAAVAAASAAAAAAIGAGGASGSAPGPVPVSGIPHTAPAAGSNPSTPTLAVGTSPHPGGAASAAERRPGRRKKITPLREDLKRRGNAAVGPPPAVPAGAEQQQPSAAVPSAAHQEQHQRLPPQHASQHHGHMVRLPAGPPPPPTSTAAPPPVGLRPPIPPATSIHNTAHQNATAMAAAAAAAAAAQELAIKVHSRSAEGGGAGVGGSGMHVNEPPLTVPSSVAHLSYFRSENPLFAHRLGPLPSSILSSGSNSLQRIAAISGAAGPPTVYGDPTAYNGGWKPPPPGSNSKMKSSGSAQPPPPPPSTHPAGMMVGPPPIGSLEHYHEYNPANHYNPYYNVLDRAHLRPPPTIGELHRTSTLSPTTFTTLQPLEFQHVLKPAGDNHHHHHSATSSPASTAGEDVGGGGGGSGRGSAGSVVRLVAPSHAGGPPPSSSVPASSENHPSVVEAASPPPSASVAVSVAPSSLVPPAAVPVAASTAASTTSSSSTSVFGELVSYFSSQQDDLDS